MSAKIRELFDRLKHERFCAFARRTTPLLIKEGLRLPDDLAAFCAEFAGGDIFTERGGDGIARYAPDKPGNGWQLDAEPFQQSANDQALPETRDSQITHYDRCYVLGRDSQDQFTMLCVDLNASQFGWIFVYNAGGYGPMGVDSVPVVAKSFAEWLERTLDFGPRFDPDDEGLVESGYWLESDTGYPDCVVPEYATNR